MVFRSCLVLALLIPALSADDPAWLVAGTPGLPEPGDLDEQLRDVVSIFGDTGHQVAIDFEGGAFSWGADDKDQLTLPATTGVAAASLGKKHTLLLTDEGEVLAAGWNASGQTAVPEGLETGALAVAAGDYFSVAVTSEGAVLAWGFAESGQTIVPEAAGSAITAVAAGQNHVLALNDSGGVVAWGENFFGQTTVPPEAEEGVVAIVAGASHSAALKDDGSVIVWGRNQFGQRNVPVAAGSGVIALASGENHLVVLKDDGTVLAWGDDSVGQATVPTAAQGDTSRIAAGGNASWFKVAEPSIQIEQPAGEALASGGSAMAFGPVVTGDSVTRVFRITNDGDGALEGVTVVLDGDAVFSLATTPPTSIAVGASEDFEVLYDPAGSGTSSATLRIASNDPEQPEFTATLAGEALSPEEDGDGDGFNDWAEYLLRDLGFDRAVDQTAEADELLAKLNQSGLVTEEQIGAIGVPAPVIARDADSGDFVLTLDVTKSDDLESFPDRPLVADEVSVNAEGDIEIRLAEDGDKAFLRIEVDE